MEAEIERETEDFRVELDQIRSKENWWSGLKELSKSFILDEDTWSTLTSSYSPKKKGLEPEEQKVKFSILLSNDPLPAKKQTMKALKSKKGVRILEDYFYHEDKKINDV